LFPNPPPFNSISFLTSPSQDYSLRAKDFNKKKAQLKNLRDKAAERNEDEFYFGMMSRKGPGSKIQDGKRWSGTVHGDRGNKVMDVDTVRILKTQDLGYVRTMRQVVSKEVAKLEEQVVLTRGFDKLDEDENEQDDEDSDSEFDFATAPSRPKAPRKIVFMDDEEQREETLQDHLDLEDENDTDKKQDKKDGEVDEEFERAKALRRLRRQLENARKKLKVLTEANSKSSAQRWQRQRRREEPHVKERRSWCGQGSDKAAKRNHLQFFLKWSFPSCFYSLL
jgi:U3 small nucleolar RNA-associated protein 11